MSCFALNPAAEVREVTIAGFPALIIDELYAAPDELRRRALALDELPVSGAYPGVAGIVAADTGPLLDCVQRHLGAAYGFSRRTLRLRQPGVFEFRRLTLGAGELRSTQTVPHVDDALLACVVYLVPPPACRGGLAFYRHLPTGLEALYLEADDETGRLDRGQQALLARLGLYNGYLALRLRGDSTPYGGLVEAIYGRPAGGHGYIGGDTEHWRQTRVIEMRFNRLVLFPGFLFHSPLYQPSWFGTSKSEQRLSQNLFFPGVRSGGGVPP